MDEYDIINDIDLYDFIYKFDSDNEIKNDINNDIEIGSFFSYFEMDGYIKNILKSYTNDDNILTQFKKDYPRQSVKLNGIKYDINEFCDKLDYLLDNKTKIMNVSCNLLIKLLCCQSSFCFPYKILIQKYKLNNDNRILVCNSQYLNSLCVDIEIKNDNIIIELKNILCIKNIESNINTHKINSLILIELNKKNNYDPLMCIFHWIINVI